MMKLCIPSYRRANCILTVDYLAYLGYGKDEIMLYTQDEEDYEKYQKIYSDRCTVCYKKADNVAQNRNNILSDLLGKEEYVVFLDDDIYAINRLEMMGGKKYMVPITDRQVLDRYIDLGYSLCKQHNTILWSVYPIPDPFFLMYNYSEVSLINGKFFGLINNGTVMFNDFFQLYEDVELSCIVLKKYGKVIRINSIAIGSPEFLRGGRSEVRNNVQVKRAYMNLLLTKHRDILMPHRRKMYDVELKTHAIEKYLGKLDKSEVI